MPTGFAANLDGRVVEKGETVSKIEGTYSNHTNEAAIGPFINNSGTISQVIAEVVGNTGNFTSKASLGLIVNNSDGIISSIEGKYTNNTIAVGSSNYDGAVITNLGHIGTITADFIGNSISTKNASGGAIYTVGNSSIDEIHGNFTNNSISSIDGSAHGGAIRNYGGNINSITGSFTGNYATSASTNGQVSGGAISLINGKIGSINANFKENYIESESTSQAAMGGAISCCGELDSLSGTFTGNHAKSISSPAVGGVLYAENSTIGSISGVFKDNYAESINRFGWGGAIVLSSGNVENISGVYENNRAIGVRALGGAIVNRGSITNISALFKGNSAQSTSDFSKGGAIYNENTITNIISDFINNNATSTEGSSAYGGAIYTTGTTGIGSLVGNFINNSATSTSGNVYGGAINIGDESVNSKVGSIDGIFISNSATSETRAYGGAINIYSGSTVDRIGSSNNPAIFAGNTTNSVTSYSYGGAIYNNGEITDGIYGDFIGNTAITDNVASIARAGAIYAINGQISTIAGNFIGNKSVKVNNEGQGGAIFSQASSITSITGDFINNEAGAGAAIYNYKSTINNITGNFIGNKTIAQAGAIMFDGGAGVNAGTSVVNSINANFINNSINTISDSTNAYGGAIANLCQAGSATITSIGTSDNHAMFSGNSINATNHAEGGAIYNSSLISNIYGDFINNSVTSTDNLAQGGAIYNTGTISNLSGEFKGNSITGVRNSRGGAIYNEGTINITDSYFNSNRVNADSGVSVQSGAIYNSGTMTITDTSFRNNTSTYDAGAIRNEEGNLTINAVNKDVLFYGDKASYGYNSILNVVATLNYNANAGRDIVMGGHISGSATPTLSTININQGTTNIGGEYIFNNNVKNNNFNLYNGADVRFGNVRQLDNSITFGSLENIGNLTNDTKGGYLNFANLSSQHDGNIIPNIYFGDLTLNSDLKIGLDFNRKGRGDVFSANSVTANGKSILIDYMNVIGSEDGTTFSYSITDNEDLKAVFDLSDTLAINSEYEWNGYEASYDKSTGTLTVTKVDTGVENLAGFLHNNTTDSVYNMTRDEQVLVDLGALAGTDVTINANGNTIIGNQQKGISLSNN